MAKNVGFLKAILTLDSVGFGKAIDRSRRQLDKFGQGMLLGAGRIIKYGAALAAVGVGAAAAFTKRAADQIDETAKLADRLNISTEALTGFQHAAELAGSSTEGLNAGIAKMAVNIGKAAEKGDDADKTFSALGLSATELAKQDAAKQFEQIADAINRLPDAAARAAATVAVFGKSGGELAATLALGSKGLAETVERMKSFGVAINRVDSRKVEEANDALTDVGTVLEGVWKQLAVKVSPIVTEVATRFVEWATSAGGVGEKVGMAVDFIVKGIGVAGDLLQDFILGWKGLELVAIASISAIMDHLAKIDNVMRKINDFVGIENKGTAIQDLAVGARQAMHEKIDDVAAYGKQERFSSRINRWASGIQSGAQSRAEAAQAADPLMAEQNKLLQQIKMLLSGGFVVS